MVGREQPSRGAVEAVRRMCRAVGADALLAEHEAYFGGVLPHALVTDLRDVFVELQQVGDDAGLTRFAEALEDMAGDQDASARNVVESAFVEGLVFGGPGEQAALPALRAHAGPITSAAVQAAQAERARRRRGEG